MRRVDKAKNLKKIVMIRELQKSQASQELITAQQDKADREIAEKKTQSALEKSYKTWRLNLTDGQVFPESLRYYFDEMTRHDGKHKQARRDHVNAMDFAKAKDESLARCEATLKKANEIHTKVKRKVSRANDERAMTKYEQVTTFKRSRKS